MSGFQQNIKSLPLILKLVFSSDNIALRQHKYVFFILKFYLIYLPHITSFYAIFMFIFLIELYRFLQQIASLFISKQSIHQQQTMQTQSWSSMDYYYFSNRLWIDANVVLIVPFLISCYFRFFNQRLEKIMWTDHFARFFIFFSWCFYIFDMWVKYPVDGAHTICQKAFFIHHGSSLFILPPIILNKHIPWWVSPIGFMHGFCIKFPELQVLNYVYALCLFLFHYGVYQYPYREIKGYWLCRFFINFIWIFAIMLLIGNCSNYLPTGPDK